MGKKILLWVIFAFSFVVTIGTLFSEWEVGPVEGLVAFTFLMMFVSRLIFDENFARADFRKSFFYYVVSLVATVVVAVAAAFFIEALYNKISLFVVKDDPNTSIFQEYQKRLADVRGESAEFQKKLEEEARARAFEEEWRKNQEPTDEPVVSEREKELLQELAQTNSEPLAGTAIMIEKEDGDFLRGRVVFAAEPRKNSIFFARQRKDSDKWEIFQNQMNDGLDCDGYEGSEIEIPKSMLEDCIKYEKNGKIRAAEGWNLTSGDPDQDCSAVTYSSEVEIDAWFEWRNSYVEKEWMLAVAENDRPKLLLGWPWKPYFSVHDISDKLRAKLMAASSENPAKVTVKKIHHYCEGAPWLDIE
ncbi:MAG: hypothetical protein E6Q06_02735 [Candidatus Moraniibacteriota bacterium]|jgi:hypothetical protein|nr:MAG: hypothetical protein E6Q06_02735 [Candidatus Moranbacteria bacterium]